MDRITLPKNSTDSFITLLIYSDRGAMIAVENITEIQSYVLTISPPKHTNTSTQKLKNLGTISIPEGSLVNWKIETLHTDSILLNINDQNILHASFRHPADQM